ncbi:MAG: Smr/MutS family protein [Rickettsiales bacterium]
MSDKIAEHELKDWFNYLKNPDEIDHSIETNKISEPLIIDLHFYNLEQAVEIITKAINFAQKQQIRNLQIITGIGKNDYGDFGILYTEIPRIIEARKQQYNIANFSRNVNNPGILNIKLKK